MTQSSNSHKGVIFSGMRPTGLLHLGNYMGALQNWVTLQQDYNCIYCAVDIHALTTVESPEDTNSIKPNIEDMVLDWLAAGIDPEQSIIFVQSHVPEVMSLHTLLSMVTPLGWLTRVPSFKDKVRQMHETEETVNYGLVGYPVLMTADIILYKADAVPVGQDQIPHVELSREIVRRFNNMFGDTFPEPQVKLTEAPLILGLDGQNKMSKTLDNHLDLAATPEETTKRVLTAFTDPQRIRRDMPGRPEVCNIYSLHKIFSGADASSTVYSECTTAQRGCVDCKRHLAGSINEYLRELRERREDIKAKPGYVQEVLHEGGKKARAIAVETMAEVYEKMGLG
ncbi:MAG: tryptophan--tRNA ligase [Chloroflexi bacterium]|nr:tryptophan--tRNA ligase [Chloroflexota bacterium]MDA1271718.1 tryptophan--tRNA ligase [Chloroflexota bacterium]PKB59135.1 MAG: tryptophan--tRNA ligase [SAR202 cluster bacterium Casp-Chloro-G2]